MEIKPEVKVMPEVKPITRAEVRPEVRVIPEVRTEVKPEVIVKPRTVTTTITRAVTRTVTKTTTRTPTRTTTTYMDFFRLPPPPPPPPPDLWLPRFGRPIKRAFVAEIKRYGEWQPLGKPLPRGRALKLGAMEARKTLGATFRIIPTEKFTAMSDIAFKPSEKIFRTYKIEKGMKKPLKDTYIQFAHKRLSKLGEVREIQETRKRRLMI